MVSLPLNGDVVIGRGEGVQVRLRDGSISRAHARISMFGGRAEIVDLESQNGTKVMRTFQTKAKLYGLRQKDRR